MIGARRHCPFSVRPRSNRSAVPTNFARCSINGPLQRTALCYGRFGGAFSVAVPESVSFVQGLPIRGVGEHVNNGMTIPYSPRKGAVGASGVLALSYQADLEILAVFMKPDALHNILSGLIGAVPAGKLELDQSNYDWRPEPRTYGSKSRCSHDRGTRSRRPRYVTPGAGRIGASGDRRVSLRHRP
jgi:hypothetical protein